jgi:hypothetical protein
VAADLGALLEPALMRRGEGRDSRHLGALKGGPVEAWNRIPGHPASDRVEPNGDVSTLQPGSDTRRAAVTIDHMNM